MVVSNIFFFTLKIGEDEPNLTHIFRIGLVKNHQPARCQDVVAMVWSFSRCLCVRSIDCARQFQRAVSACSRCALFATERHSGQSWCFLDSKIVSMSRTQTHHRNLRQPGKGFLPTMTNNLQRSAEQVLHPAVFSGLDGNGWLHPICAVRKSYTFHCYFSIRNHLWEHGD